MRRIALLMLLLLPLLKGEETCVGPWLTGPLLTPSGHVIPKGYINIEPYVFYLVDTGIYDSNWNGKSTPDFTSNQYLLPICIGLTPWMDIEIQASATWQNFEGVSTLVFNDFELELEFQLLADTEHNTVPGIKVYVGESFPTGPYQKLDPDKLLTDSGGNGSLQTIVEFVVTNTFELPCCHYFTLRANPYVTPFSTTVHVKGFNTFGGSSDTDAKVHLPTTWGLLVGMEYNLTQNWALAIDGQAIYETKQTFSGSPGTGPDGAIIPLDRPAGFQFSITPAIEYNISAEMGFVGGLWFTISGKNQPRFFGGAIAFNYFGHAEKGKRHRYRTSGGAGG